MIDTQHNYCITSEVITALLKSIESINAVIPTVRRNLTPVGSEWLMGIGSLPLVEMSSAL